MLFTRDVPTGSRFLGGNSVGKNLLNLKAIDFADTSGMTIKGENNVIRIDIIKGVAKIHYKNICKK